MRISIVPAGTDVVIIRSEFMTVHEDSKKSLEILTSDQYKRTALPP